MQPDLDDIGPAPQPLEDVFDGVREGGDGLADGGHAFAVDALEVFLGVGQGQAGVLPDRVEQFELLLDEGVVLG